MNATLTVRELKNKNTGIDVAITACKEESGIVTIKLEYAILVVSNLSCFKSSKHTPRDVVQFVIKRTEESFLQLHKIVSSKFSSLIFPTVTPVGLALFKDVNTRQKKEDFERFLQFVVANKETATYPLVLEFLGVNPIRAHNYKQQSVEEEAKSVRGDSTHDIFEEQVDDLDLFVSKETSDKRQDENNSLQAVDGNLNFEEENKVNLFSQNDNSYKNSDEIKLFDDQDYGGDNENLTGLLLPGALTTPTISPEENNQELLTIEDGLDKLLNINQISSPQSKKNPTISAKPKSSTSSSNGNVKAGVKPNLPPKPVKKPKPKCLEKQASDNSASSTCVQSPESQSTENNDIPVDNASLDDIARYISLNSSENHSQVDLFS